MGPDYTDSNGLSTGPERSGFFELRETMRGVMRKLEAKNPEYNNQLFGIFGRGEARIFVLNTPVTIDGRKTQIDRYLVVTEAGFKLIGIDDDYNKEMYKRLLKQHLETRQNNQNLPSPQENEYKYGYWRDQTGEEWIRLGEDETSVNSLTIRSKGESYALESGGPGPETSLVRLITTPEPTTVTKIIELNLERVRSIPEQREKERDASIKPHFEAAQKIDEILG